MWKRDKDYLNLGRGTQLEIMKGRADKETRESHEEQNEGIKRKAGQDFKIKQETQGMTSFIQFVSSFSKSTNLNVFRSQFFH